MVLYISYVGIISAQSLTLLFPPRYFIEMMCSVYLRGTSFIDLYPQLVP